MKELIIATANPKKFKELEQILAPISCQPQTALGISSPIENGLSFIENALIKARHVSAFAQKPALADDSGLIVPALNNEPGIYSARYAGEQASDEENNSLLLRNMASLSGDQRQAYFYCALVLVQNAKDPVPLLALGRLDGFITEQAAGTQGFGYDPIFYLPDYQCTLAQLPVNIKNTLSHRAQALNHLLRLIKNNEY